MRGSRVEDAKSADKKMADLEAELVLAKAGHEQALLRQAEHASQTQRQLEVLCQAFVNTAAALLINVPQPQWDVVLADAE